MSTSPPSRARPEQCRRDGWTTPRQLAFLILLARTRSVSDAARGVGMSREGAYRFRRRDPNGLFAAFWDTALARAPGPARAEIDQGHGRAIAAACATKGRAPPPKPGVRSSP